MATWGEMLNQYVTEKCHSPPQAEPVVRRLRKAKNKVQYGGTNTNIITGSLKDSNAQSEFERTARDVEQERVRRAVAKEMAMTTQPLNILTMETRYKSLGFVPESDAHEAKASPAKHMRRDSVSSFNIISGGGDAAPSEPIAKPPREPRNRRQTNILNHEYVDNNEARQAEDRRKLEEQVLSLCAARELNVLTGKFYDREREIQEQQKHAKHEELTRALVGGHTYKTSGIVERSEGHAFNIVTNQVYNPEKVLALDRSNIKGLPQRTVLRQQWEYRRDAEDAITDANISRSLNRISLQRVNETQGRGYDVLSNKPYGLSREELRAGVHVDESLREGTMVAAVPAAVLQQRPVLERLQDTMKEKPPVVSSAFHAEGPRSTHERVLNAAPSPPIAFASTFAGRRELMLPTIEKASGQPVRTTW